MQFHTILTHEYPDLDAILCCYLLHSYGETKYPGISNAKIEFCPAGRLPDDKTPDELEQEGILPVDIGGGRLDTHPTGTEIADYKRTTAAANLVAIDLGVDKNTSLVHLLEFVRLHDSTGKSLSSRNPIDHAVALPNMIRGGTLFFQEKFIEMVKFFFQIFQAIELAESSSKSLDFKKGEAFLLATEDEKLFIPTFSYMPSVIASYISTKFLKKKLSISSQIPATAKRWESLEDYLNAKADEKTIALTEKFATFAKQLKAKRYLLGSTSETDCTVSFCNILHGIHLLFPNDNEAIADLTFQLLDCIVSYEQSWLDAIEEYQAKKKIYIAGKIKVVVVSAENGAVSKVARWKDKADLIVFQDQERKHIGISINRVGRLKHGNLKRLASRLRASEIIQGNLSEDPDAETLMGVGEVGHWFLHQSEKLLLHGSPKASRDPSKLDLETITNIILTEFDQNAKLPDAFCPVDRCTHHNCLFYRLKLSNCFHHRQNLRSP